MSTPRAFPEAVEVWLRNRFAAEVSAAPGRTVRGPDHDVEEGGEEPTSAVVDLVGLTVHLVYRDAAGQESERVVQCLRARLGNGVVYLEGRCQLRRAPRCFRGDRIVHVVDLATGEVLSAVDFFTDIGLYDGRTGEEAFLEHVRHGLTVLMAIARADGHVHADELEVALRWADRLAEVHGIRLDEKSVARLRRIASNVRPDEETARLSFRRAISSPEEARLLTRHIRQMVDADRAAHPGEIALIETLAWVGGGEAP